MPALTIFLNMMIKWVKYQVVMISTRKPPFCCVHFDPWWFAHVPSRSKPVEPEEPVFALVDLSKIADPWGEVVVDGWPFFFWGQHRCIDGIILYIHMFHFSIVRYTTFCCSGRCRHSCSLWMNDRYKLYEVTCWHCMALSPSLIRLQDSKLSKWFKEAMIYHAGPGSETFATFLC